MAEEHSSQTVPLSEKLKSIPGIFGIRLADVPVYDVLTSDSEVEIRSYHPLLLASISINGSFEEAKTEAYSSLANYIFGKNKDKKKLKTVPPSLEEENNFDLAMTSPVLYEPTDFGWTLSFYLPEEYNLATAPTPRDRRIQLFTRPARVMACLSYSGINSEEKIKKYSHKLMLWVEANHLYDPIGTIQSAEYDGPSTIPFLRKNEVMIEVNGI